MKNDDGNLVQAARILTSGIVMATSGVTCAFGTPTGIIGGVILFIVGVFMVLDSWDKPPNHPLPASDSTPPSCTSPQSSSN